MWFLNGTGYLQIKETTVYSLLKSNREEPTDLGNEFEDAIPYLQWRESCNIEIIGDGLKLKDIDFDKFPDKPPLLAKEMEDQRGRKLKRFYVCVCVCVCVYVYVYLLCY